MRLTIIILFIASLARAQVTIYSENFGSSPSFTPVSTYAGYQHYGVYGYSGTASVRNTLPSTGYAGASGGANIFFTNVAGTYIQIDGIDTYCYLYAFLSVGIYKSTTASTGAEFVIEYSDNGGAWVQMPFTLPTGAGSAIWRNITLADDLPITTNLSIRFTQTSSAGVQFRIDDINIAGIQNATDTFITNCTGFFYDGNLYTADSLYEFVEQDYKGCDSLVRIEYQYNPADPSCILPVQLVSFTGAWTGVSAFEWWTASEYNTAYFEIETLTDNWYAIARIPAAGYSSAPRRYEYLYEFPGYFRLKMVDFDGHVSYSFPVFVRGVLRNTRYFNILGQELREPDRYGIRN